MKWSKDTVHVFFTVLLVGIIPFDKVLVSYAVFLWLVSALVVIFSNEKRSSFRFDIGLISFLLLYLVFVFGIIYSENKAEAWFDVQVKLSLLIIPPVIFVLRNFYYQYRNLILLFFVFANIVAGLLCLTTALYRSFDFSNGTIQFNPLVPAIFEDTNTSHPTFFSYTYFSLFKHPAYFSMYLILCVFILIYFYENSCYFIKNTSVARWLYAGFMIFFVLILYFLESKAAYLTLFLLAFIYAVYYSVKRKKWIVGALVLLAVIIAGSLAYKNSSRFYYIKTAAKNVDDFVSLAKKREYQKIIDKYGIDRIPIWMIATEIFEENLWIGVGSGDVSDAMVEKYAQYRLDMLESKHLNTHNQFLAVAVSSGIIGLIVLLFWILFPFFLKKYYHRNSFLVLILLGIIAINFIFESVLNTISGVIFIAFFYPFLLYVFADKDTQVSDF